MKKTYITLTSYLLTILALGLFVNHHYILAVLVGSISVLSLLLIMIVNFDQIQFTNETLSLLFIQIMVICFFRSTILQVSLSTFISCILCAVYNTLFMMTLKSLPDISQRFFKESMSIILSIALLIVSISCFIINKFFNVNYTILVSYMTLLILLYIPFVQHFLSRFSKVNQQLQYN